MSDRKWKIKIKWIKKNPPQKKKSTKINRKEEICSFYNFASDFHFSSSGFSQQIYSLSLSFLLAFCSLFSYANEPLCDNVKNRCWKYCSKESNTKKYPSFFFFTARSGNCNTCGIKVLLGCIKRWMKTYAAILRG